MLSKSLIATGLCFLLAEAIPHNDVLSRSQSSAMDSYLLYATSYSGIVHTLNLTLPAPGCNGAASLRAVATTDQCGGKPSWLTFNHDNSLMYCTNQGFGTPNGSLTSFQTSKDGSLTPLSQVVTPYGAVHASIYGDGGKGMVVAHYSGSAMSTYSIANPASLQQLESWTWQLEKPGPNPQNAPHPHEAVVDPTGNFILVPDLGADLIRIFAIDRTTLKLTTLTPHATPAGSGPRHLVFHVTEGKTLAYLASELGNTVTVFEVIYQANNAGLVLNQVYVTSTHGEGNTAPKGAAAAELVFSPDNKYLVVSSRLEGTLSIPNFDPKNETAIPSDPIFNFEVQQETGALSLVQTVPAGGMVPRHFSMNKAGTLVAVGLQQDFRVVIMKRDVATGRLGDIVAQIKLDGEVTFVIFDE
ncbi:uncharacterized protein E0L32_010743 [Thyridium curvatum]|uniref:6-phosphogluconolactonase n=1 Tax=Thyridium curvatum TaxID=1093900 RepID=A0A507AR28_9PEZI|nr:uncharacterized protein E0L32_010743 [Thyridium curvatum]TPX07321.1 hypothetical protein E0L32_010743 [Thyridium curvatum]